LQDAVYPPEPGGVCIMGQSYGTEFSVEKQLYVSGHVYIHVYFARRIG